MLLETIKTYKDKYTGEIFKTGSTRTVEAERGKALIARHVAVEVEEKKTKKAEKKTEETAE